MKSVENLNGARLAVGRVAPRAGQVIGERYRLEQLLERGAMGSVWRAEQIRLRSPVAVKFLEPSLIGVPEMRERFMQEARSAAAIRGAHVVQIYDYGSEGDVPYIAMELLEGENLDARLSRCGMLAPSELRKIFGEVALGIGQAHLLGVVHRDVKPGNIFLAREGGHEVAKLIDFGIAKVKADALQFTQIIGTQLGTLLGTPQYMSPEQVRGSSTVDHRTDLWALAIIACECLTGSCPFPGLTLGDLTVQICTEKPRAPSALGRVPAGFDHWFFKATAKNPNRRFASVEEMAEALDRILSASRDSLSPSRLLALSSRVEVRRFWAATTRRLSTLARYTIGGFGAGSTTFAAGPQSAALDSVPLERLGFVRLLSSRPGLLVSALMLIVIIGCGLAFLWLPRGGASERAFQEETSQTIQAASLAPVGPALPPSAASSPADGTLPPADGTLPSTLPIPRAGRVAQSAPVAKAAEKPGKVPNARRVGKRLPTPSTRTSKAASNASP